MEEPAPEPEPQQLRSLRDFLLVYNRMTELCFQRCVANLNYRALTRDEEACLDGCAGKLVRSNHRLMAAYVQLMPSVVQRRIADYEAAGRAAAPPGPTPPAPAAALPGPEGFGAS
ncbi:mitochondrial import inner membrane translocase subunit Tim10 B [Candoia aspera]|uniref:mitochondrial import inner membrane translocase subunit Tim10 B n=1 Tax=Candoia aspera TaxID=51853 RepID=UPI002FD7D4F1